MLAVAFAKKTGDPHDAVHHGEECLIMEQNVNGALKDVAALSVPII